jgi:hypothetical protein
MTFSLWSKYIDSKEEGSFLQGIRKHTLTGRPLGAALFIERLEAKFGRKICALPIGRPKQI